VEGPLVLREVPRPMGPHRPCLDGISRTLLCWRERNQGYADDDQDPHSRQLSAPGLWYNVSADADRKIANTLVDDVKATLTHIIEP
jgi:hypothetical protein